MIDKRVAVSGSSGFIGKALCKELKALGYEVFFMVRKETKKPDEIFYNYEDKKIDLEKLKSCFAVIHLAGKNIMAGPWTKSLKKEIYDSRVKSTRFISHCLSELKDGPKVLLNASAIGIYGNRSDQKLDEDIEPSLAHSFLEHVCLDWERGTLFAKKAGLRVVNMRISTVLDKSGGMLKMMIPIFKLGLGAILGTGEQYLSYITQTQLIEQILFLLQNPHIEGPVNMCSLEPVTNEQFTRALAKALHRPLLLKVPAFLLKMLGEQGALLLSSQRAYPKVLIDAGFDFDDHHKIAFLLKELLKEAP